LANLSGLYPTILCYTPGFFITPMQSGKDSSNANAPRGSSHQPKASPAAREYGRFQPNRHTKE
ncbi:MAG: hypothetical protein R6X32_23960, partial [Chloroflexota bacterium]